MPLGGNAHGGRSREGNAQLEHGPHGGGRAGMTDYGSPQVRYGTLADCARRNPPHPHPLYKMHRVRYTAAMATRRASEPMWVPGTQGAIQARLMKHSVVAGDHIFWRGAEDRRGYGMMHITGMFRDRMVRVHHIAWWLAYGTIPAGRNVKRRCNVEACIAKEHLYLAESRVAKGRASKPVAPDATVPASSYRPVAPSWAAPAQRSASPESGPAGSAQQNVL